MPVFNRKDLTLKCLESLANQTFKDFTIVVCDHGSTDGTSEAIRLRYSDVMVVEADSSLWWTGAVNRSVEYALGHAADGDSLLAMNNDNEVPADYLQNMAANYRKYPDAIITSVVHDINTGELVSPGYRQNWALAKARPVDFARDHLPGDSNSVEVTHASGRGTLFPVKVFRELGLFDEKHLPHYAADYDFTFKAARAGYKIYSVLDCKVLSYVEETGMVRVLNQQSLKSVVDYFSSIRSPANLKARWWYGWNNCPKRWLPVYFAFDLVRIFGSLVRRFLKGA